VKEVLRLRRRFNAFDIGGAGDQLVTICQQLPGNQRRILERPQTKNQIYSLGDMIDQTVRYQDLNTYIGVGSLESGHQWHQQRIGNAGWR
jgi:hypothetical protein